MIEKVILVTVVTIAVVTLLVTPAGAWSLPLGNLGKQRFVA